MGDTGHRAWQGRLAAGLAFTVASLCLAQSARPDTLTPRQQVQHLLHRFAYSASPADVDAVLAQGKAAWVAQQLNWKAIDDSKGTLNTPPHAYADPNNCNFCLPNYNAFDALFTSTIC